MEVFEFEKCYLDRLDESMVVLKWKDESIPASRVRSEWAYNVEVLIEPAGWQSLWKIPRVICEELKLHFPTVVFGVVDQVLFKELKATFFVTAVQDDDVQIPEKQIVNLIDLWPTKNQENSALNTETTAEFIDRLRFFYRHVWMPWDNDNDDDLDWVEKNLEPRIRFYFDLKRNDIKRSLASHIRLLLLEAQYIQQRREFLEINLSDDENLNESRDKSNITELMRFHLRLTMIKSEIEMLENPELRKIYEEIKYNEPSSSLSSSKEYVKDKQSIAYIVSTPLTISDHFEYLNIVKKSITEDQLVQICPSLQDVLNMSNSSDVIFLSRGRHTIQFLEHFHENGSVQGLVESSFNFTGDNYYEKDISLDDIVISSRDDDSIFLLFDGNFTLKNLTLDCRNVRSGIMVKSGILTLQNCRIVGNSKSSTSQGIVCSNQSEVILEDCLVQEFATGIVLTQNAEATLKNTRIYGTGIGVEISGGSNISFDNCFISKCFTFGIHFTTNLLDNQVEEKNLKLNELSDIEQYLTMPSPLTGNCTFNKCEKSNIFILNERSNFRYFLESQLELLDANLNESRESENDQSEICLIDDSVIEVNCDSDTTDFASIDTETD